MQGMKIVMRYVDVAYIEAAMSPVVCTRYKKETYALVLQKHYLTRDVPANFVCYNISMDKKWRLALRNFIAEGTKEALVELAQSRPDLRAIAVFHPQYENTRGDIWPDEDSPLWGQTFDVTEEILNIGIKEALSIEDDQIESDELLPPWIDEQHDGPFKVEVENAIESYFTALLGSYVNQYFQCPGCGGEGVTCSKCGLLSKCGCQCYCCGSTLEPCDICGEKAN